MMAVIFLSVFYLCSIVSNVSASSKLRHSTYERRSGDLSLRQSCSSGYKVCGTGCILNSYTCCPDQAGGCPSNEYCVLGTNGQYGCCPDGETCVGDGGVETSTLLSTATRTTSTRLSSVTTSTRASTATSLRSTVDGEALHWATTTVTLADGDTSTLSFALYEGGYVSNSAQLEWETLTLTANGQVTVATFASYPQDGVADYLDWYTATETLSDGVRTTYSYAFYEGGTVTNSDELIWSTATRTLSDGDLATFTVVSYPATNAANIQTTGATSSRASSTRASSTTTARSSSATASSSQITASSSGTAVTGDQAYLMAGFIAAGLAFVTMLWL